jgi:hypothetical protein
LPLESRDCRRENVEVADNSEQKILVLVLWRVRIQAEHVGSRGNNRVIAGVASCQVEWRSPVQEKEGDFLS